MPKPPHHKKRPKRVVGKIFFPERFLFGVYFTVTRNPCPSRASVFFLFTSFFATPTSIRLCHDDNILVRIFYLSATKKIAWLWTWWPLPSPVKIWLNTKINCSNRLLSSKMRHVFNYQCYYKSLRIKKLAKTKHIMTEDNNHCTSSKKKGKREKTLSSEVCRKLVGVAIGGLVNVTAEY